jgi:spermidine synthase
MTAQPPGQPTPPPVSPRFLPALVLLFVGSGCAALIYEVVWLQLLQLIIGSSAISLGVLLATFMGGMCVGSLLLGRVIPARAHPLRVYALLEAGLGVLGVLVLLGLPYVGRLYAAFGGPGVTGLLARAGVCGVCLLPPTVLMGATLPAIARWVEATPRGVSWLGFFYGGNIAGAVFGCLLAGFYLLRVHDMATATYAAAAINATAALVGLGLSVRTPHEAPAEGGPGAAAAAPGSWVVLVTIALSGMTALGAEVVWTRLLSLLLGATVYTFSLILAAFLLGLGVGSGVGSLLARSAANPRGALAWCQVLLMGGLAWAAYALTQALPYWPVYPGIADEPQFIFQIDLARCLWATLPAACLWGASFPLALASVTSPGQDPGRLVGAVYAANTAGAIVGALGASLLLIGWLGTQGSQRVLIGLAGAGAVLMLATAAVGAFRRPGPNPLPAWWAVLRVGAVAGLAAWLAWTVAPVPGLLVAYGRSTAWWLKSQSYGQVLYVGEGLHSSMAVSRLPNGVLTYHNAGKVQASSSPQDMRLQRMLGHLTTLVPEHPRSVLVIGHGAGVTAGAVSIDPGVERVTIAEIEELVPRVVSKYFSAHNFGVADSPKVRSEFDDARHYLLTSREKFDAITSDPFDPWVKGAAALYTKEFFELMKGHLNPGGVVTVFVQLYESSPETVKSEVATFLEVFPHGTVWANTAQGRGYDLVLLGQAEPTRINVDRVEGRLRSPEYAPVARSLAEIGIDSAVDLFATFAGQGPQLSRWLADAQINTDRDLRLQYLAGLGLNRYEQDAIYQGMVADVTFPEDLFSGSPARLKALKAAMGWGR